MKTPRSNPLRPLDSLRYALTRLGWPGTVGLVLLAAAGLVQGLEVQALRDARIELAQHADRLAKQARPLHEIEPTQHESTQQADLSATLPGAERMPEAVARLFSAAKHAGLTLQQGAYRPVGEKPGGHEFKALMRYQISLPVAGNYPAVRAFVAEALEREPSLALDGMRLTRERMDSGEIDAELRFTLYLGGTR